MIDKVEAGKKYQLIDKEGYRSYGHNRSYNASLLRSGCFDSDLCVVVDEVDEGGWGMSSGMYIISRDEFQFFELVKENNENEEPKMITPETEVTITTTYGELVRVYYVMGKVNGEVRSQMLWKAVAGLLGDSTNSIYWENEPNHPSIDYNSVQEKWESLFFKSKEQQEKETAIKEKRAVIAKLEKEIKELEGA